MKYRFKLWKYNSYSADEAEVMLNRMAEAGWKVRNISSIVSFVPCTGIRPQYTIEVLPPGFSGPDDLEVKPMKEFYEQIGWKFLKRISEDGMYLFVNESGSSIPHAYYSKEERESLQKNRIKWSFIIGGMIGFIIMYFLLFHDVKLDRLGWGGDIAFILVVGLFAGLYIVPAISAFSYKKLGRENLLTKIDAWWNIVWNGIFALLIFLEIPLNIYLIYSGKFLNNLEEAILSQFSMISSLLAPALFILGTYLEAIAEKRVIQIGGIFMYLIAYFGGLLGLAYAEVQLGLV